MAKKDKLGIEKLIERVNKELEKSTKQIDKLMTDATNQLESLQNQVQEPIKKLLEDIEKATNRELKRFQKEFDKRFQEFGDLQQTIFEKVGFQKSRFKKTDDSLSPSPSEKHFDLEEPARPVAETASTPSKAPEKKKPFNENDLTQLKGVGPVTAKLMNEAGITNLRQFVSPSPEDKLAIEKFAKGKSSAGWQEQAEILLTQK